MASSGSCRPWIQTLVLQLPCHLTLGVVDRITKAPKDVPLLISDSCDYITLHTKGDFADVIKLRVLRWGDYSGLSEWAQCNHNSPMGGGRKPERREGNVRLQTSWATWPRGREYRQPLEGPRGKKMQSLQQEHSSAGILIGIRLQTSDLKNCKIINLCW